MELTKLKRTSLNEDNFLGLLKNVTIIEDYADFIEFASIYKEYEIRFTANFMDNWVFDLDNVIKNIEPKKWEIIDLTNKQIAEFQKIIINKVVQSN